MVTFEFHKITSYQLYTNSYQNAIKTTKYHNEKSHYCDFSIFNSPNATNSNKACNLEVAPNF